MATTVPTMLSYDPAFTYELAVIIQDGLKRMFRDGEEVMYYLSVYNETMPMPAMPEGVEEGIRRGLYKFNTGAAKKKFKAHIFGSGPIIGSALKAQEILANYDVSADVWSATSYKRLRVEAMEARRWNMLNPTSKPRTSYLEDVVSGEKGVFVAVSDNMKIVAEQITPWIPGGLTVLGTDGFGRSDTREALRRFFEIDAEMTVVATLHALSEKAGLPKSVVAKAIKDLKIDPKKVHPVLV
jgi:pyruvate dehydrogenase E1 component